MHEEGSRIPVRFITNCVRSSTGERNNLTRPRRSSVNRCAKSSDVEGEFAIDHVLDLPRILPVHNPRTARQAACGSPQRVLREDLEAIRRTIRSDTDGGHLEHCAIATL